MKEEIKNIKKQAMDMMQEEKKDHDFLTTIYHIADILEYCDNCSSGKSDAFYAYDKRNIADKLKRISKRLENNI
jgi:hypothetical protein